MILYRYYRESDKSLIYSTFLRGNRHGCDYNKEVDSDAFYAAFTARLDTILSDKQNTVYVACLEEDQEIVLGWAIVGKEAIHWIYVKEPWRCQGIAKGLVGHIMATPGRIAIYTHTTKPGRALALKHKLKFNPYLPKENL
jgi:GNAT superfamily N-acetyltransferase